MIAIRGAVQSKRNEPEAIRKSTRELLQTLAERNDLKSSDLLAVWFTSTPDLDAAFPASAARQIGWTSVPMLGAQEIGAAEGMKRVIRVLVLAQKESSPHHTYLGKTAQMRPDWAQQEAVRAQEQTTECISSAHFPQTALIVGVGLMGGSLGLALRERKLFREVIGWDRDSTTLEQACKQGAIDQQAHPMEASFQQTDVVFLTLPIQETKKWLEKWGDKLQPGTAVLDLSSTREALSESLEKLPEGVSALGAHPMAGSEQTGFQGADRELYRGAQWILTATQKTDETIRTLAINLIEELEGRVVERTPRAHDRQMAAVSHLPYLLSVGLAQQLYKQSDTQRLSEVMGPGAQDMLRLSRANPQIMAEILMTNRAFVQEQLLEFRRQIEQLAAELKDKEDEELHTWLQSIRKQAYTIIENTNPKSATYDADSISRK